MNKKIIIVGAFHEVIELAEENGIQIIGLIDNGKKKSYLNYPVLGNDSEAELLSKSYMNISLVITPDAPKVRAHLFHAYNNIGYSFTSLISSKSKISKSAKIGMGTIIQTGVNVSSEVIIGQFVKLNSACNIMHNSIIGDFTTIAPNVVILGYVTIGNLSYIGANATILPNISIGENVIIGAGSVVTKNVPNNKVMIGNPARELIK